MAEQRVVGGCRGTVEAGDGWRYGAAVGLTDSQVRVATDTRVDGDDYIPGEADLFELGVNGPVLHATLGQDSVVTGSWDLSDDQRTVFESAVLEQGDWQRDLELYDLSQLGSNFQVIESPLSVFAGAERAMVIDAGPESAGDLYVVLGSTSGSDPGIELPGGLILPLNVDEYFWTSLRLAGVWPIQDAVGTLDESGRAVAAFRLTPNTTPALAGLTMTHAMVVLQTEDLHAVQIGGPRSFSLED